MLELTSRTRIALLGLLATLCWGASPGFAAPAPVLRASLSNGLRLITRANDSSEVVAITCLIQAGLPDEKPGLGGIAALTAEALLQGTTVRDAKAFRQAVQQAGISLTSRPGADFTEVTMVTTRSRFAPALKLVAEALAKPAFTAEGIEQARTALGRRRAQAKAGFTTGSLEALSGSLYRRGAYGRPLLGYQRTLASIKPADVRAFWERNYVQNRMVVAIVGDVKARQALDAAQRRFAGLPFRPNARTPRPMPETRKAATVKIIQRGANAAQVMVGYLAPAATAESYPVFSILEAIIGGGKAARMFQNIRIKRGLGYEMGTFYQPRRFQSFLGGYVVTPVQKRDPLSGAVSDVVEPAKTALLEQFRQLSAEGPSDSELARAKAYVIGRAALRQARNRDQARWLAWTAALNLGVERSKELSQKVNAVTKEQVCAAAKRSLRNYALVVTMPRAPRRRLR